MATYSGRKANLPGHMQAFGNVSSFTDTTTVTAKLTTTDKVRALRIPAGHTLTGLSFYHGDLDTGTGTLTMNVGWESCSGENITVRTPSGLTNAASDADAFGDGLTQFAAQIALGAARTWLAFEPITFNDDVYITLIPKADANALAATKTVTALAETITDGIK